ncbi:MAG: hypothetical protein HYU78_14915 [Rhodocyclales bacterium]|nr:hypothetical protein [Rhodocyclales bacterium]
MAQGTRAPFSFRHWLGLVSVACGLPFMLAAFDIGPLQRADIQGPPWLAVVAGGIFVAAGAALLVGKRQPTLRDALGLAVIVGLAAIGNWIAFGAGERFCQGSLPVSFFSVDGALSGWQCRLPFGFGALVTDAMALYFAILLLQRLCGGPPALARTKRAGEWLIVLSLAPLLIPLLLVLVGISAFGACRERLRSGARPRNESFIRRQREKWLRSDSGPAAADERRERR